MTGAAFQVVAFSFAMLTGSYAAGCLPLLVQMSKEKLHLVSVMGAGLLIGVAFAVIVPEGMETLLKAYQLRGRALRNDEKALNDSSSACDHLEGIDRTIGASLVFGFLFMLLVDQMASFHSKKGSPLPTSDPDLFPGKNGRVNDLGSGTAGSAGTTGTVTTWTATLGLVVHAAADGIALGAAAATDQTDVELIVFFAIMLHKAPAAFGLVTFLLHEGVDRKRTKRHLLAFVFAAPVLAIVTFAFLSASYGDGAVQNKVEMFRATGIAMLFSAGTFLYVSTVHVLPEVTKMGAGSGFSRWELLMLLLGSLLPLLLALGHSH